MKQPSGTKFSELMKGLKETYPGQVDGVVAAAAIKDYTEEERRKL